MGGPTNRRQPPPKARRQTATRRERNWCVEAMRLGGGLDVGGEGGERKGPIGLTHDPEPVVAWTARPRCPRYIGRRGERRLGGVVEKGGPSLTQDPFRERIPPPSPRREACSERGERSGQDGNPFLQVHQDQQPRAVLQAVGEQRLAVIRSSTLNEGCE